MKRTRYRLILAGTASLVLAGAALAQEAPKTAAPRPVLTVTARAITSETVGPFVGTIEPRYQTPMSFQISGRMISRPAHLGDRVQKGEVLASLDASVQRFQVDSARANLASARAQLDNAQQSEARIRALVDKNSASQAQLDSAVTARKSAEAQRDQAAASLGQAEDQLGYTTLKAGYDGIVLSTAAEVGQVVSAGGTILTLARPDVREAVFQLPETEAEEDAPKTVWTVFIIGVPQEKAVGTIREISPLITGSTRSRTVRLSLANPPEGFRLGTIVGVSYERTIPRQIRIPATAIFTESGETRVWVVDPKTHQVASRAVDLMPGDGAIRAVVSGLSDSDLVVIAGVHSLHQGQKVGAAESEESD